MDAVSRTPSGAAAASGCLWLSRWERVGLVGLALVVVLFGFLVERRTAFLHQRMGDLEVFLRTGWAVRAGADIYAVTDNHGFHYLYPPLFAILVAPLADPPPGVQQSWTVPFPVTAALWYAFNVLCLVVAVHWLAAALEQLSSDPAVRAQPAGCRRWWALRVLPVLACLAPVGHTLMRAQVGLLLLLLLSGMVVSAVRGRRGQAGWWLAAAICLKVIPAFLLLFPLWRRDGRCLAGCAAGLVVGLALVPAAVFGPARTVAYYREWADVMLLPAMANGPDQSRAKEVLEMTATDSQSLMAAFHNLRYPARQTRPAHADPETRLAHWLLGGALTVLALLAAGWRRAGDGLAAVLLFGMLVLLMLLLSPVCHLHYFCLAVPLLMGLLAAAWEYGRPDHLGKGVAALLAAYGLANALPQFPGLEPLRDLGLATGAALGLWFVGAVVLWRRARRPGVQAVAHAPVSGAAA